MLSCLWAAFLGRSLRFCNNFLTDPVPALCPTFNFKLDSLRHDRSTASVDLVKPNTTNGYFMLWLYPRFAWFFSLNKSLTIYDLEANYL